MRPRAQSYRTLEGLSAERDAVPWYWRMVAVGSSFFILGGYLMLPATFVNHDTSSILRVSQAGVGIFAVALLTAGFSFTALLCFAIRNPLFQADSIFLPALTSSCLGLLTVFYDFIVFSQYTWNTPALLTTIASAISTVIYGTLLIYFQRKITLLKTNRPNLSLHMGSQEPRDSEAVLYQEPQYYENYVRNMFPSSARAPQGESQTAYGGYDPNSITEEEMQRQQMLMLLLQREQPSTSPNTTTSTTYNIDWQGRDEDDGAPPHGYYAPGHQSPMSAQRTPHPGLARQWTSDLQPWDGIWRAPARVNTAIWQRPSTRETRRREIEGGLP